MSYPYGAGPGQPYGVMPPVARYKPIRSLGTGVIGVIGGLLLLTILQTVLFWTSISDLEVKLAIIFNDDPEAVQDVINSFNLGNALSQVTSLAWLAAGVLFMVWLWQARENAELLTPGSPHRLAKGWAIGGWFCPGVQLWFPFVVVDDVWKASRQPAVPGQVQDRGGRGLVVCWWIAYVLYWLTVIVGIPVAVYALIAWIQSLQDQVEASQGIDDVLLRQDIVDFVRATGLVATVMTVLLTIAGILAALLVWKISVLQDSRGASLGGGSRVEMPPGYHPPSYGQPHAQQGFPTYGQHPGRPQASPYGPHSGPPQASPYGPSDRPQDSPSGPWPPAGPGGPGSPQDRP